MNQRWVLVSGIIEIVMKDPDLKISFAKCWVLKQICDHFGHFEQCHLPLSSTKIFKSKPFTCLMTSCNDPYPGQLYLDSPSHIRDRRRQATTTVDETVCLFNRGFSPQTVQNRLQESNLYTHLLRRGLVLTLAWRLQRLAWVRGHTCWTLSASQRKWAAACAAPHKGAECWHHHHIQHGTQRRRHTGFGEHIPWTSHTTACHCW